MNKYLLTCVLTLFLYACGKDPQEQYAELAFRYAPIHYQDTDNSNARADYITKVDYDGNWNGTDNWDHLTANNADMRAHVYYSVVETETHWYIVYAFYHPRDWSDGGDQEHENDLEGLLEIVSKSGGDYGHLQVMITVAHNDFWSYEPTGGELTDGEEDIDGAISFTLHDNILRPMTAQEAEGHGLRAWHYAGDFSGASSEDGIIYYPSRTVAEIPSSGNDRDVKYTLVNIKPGMWLMQLAEATRDRDHSAAFAKFGTFKGDNSGGCSCPFDKANAPWGWDDHDDGPNYAGELALDPAAVADYYFNGDSFDTLYTRNMYLEDLKQQGYNNDNLPRGWETRLDIEALFRKLR